MPWNVKNVATNSRYSSWVEPSITGTLLNCPLVNAASIACGKMMPSTRGRYATGLVSCLASNVVTGTARRHAASWLEHPTAVAYAVPWVSATATVGGASMYAPLSAIACWNSPAEPGAARCVCTLRPPAD